MAFVTYILLSTLLAGLRGAFHPEVMGLTATAAFAVVVVEILGLKFGTYILSISNDSQLLDLVAYSGYKFVGVIVTLLVAEILNGGKGTGGWAGWTIFTYTFLANAFFLVSLRAPMGPTRYWSSPSFYRLWDFLPHSLNPETATISEIRAPSRLLLIYHACWKRHAHSRPFPTQSPYSISLPLRICRAIHLHVDS
jgi:hypothetical protein